MQNSETEIKCAKACRKIYTRPESAKQKEHLSSIQAQCQNFPRINLPDIKVQNRFPMSETEIEEMKCGAHKSKFACPCESHVHSTICLA